MGMLESEGSVLHFNRFHSPLAPALKRDHTYPTSPTSRTSPFQGTGKVYPEPSRESESTMSMKDNRNLALLGFLSTKDAAIFLGISVRWLEYLRQAGGGPEFQKLSRRKVTYAIQDLEAWAEQFRRKNTSQGGLATSREVL